MVNRNYLYCIIISFVLALAFIGCAKREVPALRCDMCGMDVSKSETKFRLKLHDSMKYACSFSCANMLREKLEAVSAIETTDYNTARFINVDAATFVVQSDVIPKGSMPPFILAFSSTEDAEGFISEHNGKILDLQGIIHLLEQM